MDNSEKIKQLFASIDGMDADAFATFLTAGVRFRFGNADAIEGKAAVTDIVRGFFGSIKALRHDISELWLQADAIVCHGFVTYTRHDASELRVPFANIFKMNGELIREYLIYVDISALYAPA